MISHMVLLTVFTLISAQDLYFPPHIKSTYLYFCISNSSWIKGVSSWIKGVGVGKGRSGEDQYNKMLFSLKIPIFGIRNSLEQSTVLHSNGLYHSPSSQLILYDNTIPNYVLCWTLSTFPHYFSELKTTFSKCTHFYQVYLDMLDLHPEPLATGASGRWKDQIPMLSLSSPIFRTWQHHRVVRWERSSLALVQLLWSL